MEEQEQEPLPSLNFEDLSTLPLEDLPFRPEDPPLPQSALLDSPPSARLFRPAIPSDVINVSVDHVESSLSPLAAIEEGRRLSLVSRDFRSAGQRLVFRQVELTSLDAYSAFLRTLVEGDYRLMGFVRKLKVTHLVAHDPSTSDDIKRFFESLTQVRQRLEILTLFYVPSYNLDDFDERDLSRLVSIPRLNSLCVVWPMQLRRVFHSPSLSPPASASPLSACN
ncbi:hypothetical protein JCM8547_005471 [Rhodosporidiobolus lusitaniae]